MWEDAGLFFALSIPWGAIGCKGGTPVPRSAPRFVLLLGLLSYAATRVFLTFSKPFCSLLSHSATLAGGLMKKRARIAPCIPLPRGWVPQSWLPWVP